MSEYILPDYGRMVRDQVRTGAYLRALERVVRPDSVVLDIGSGTGILALFAARLGARRVFASESSDIIEVAREFAAVNGYADRITFIQGMSSELELPEGADVIVCDIRGVLPPHARHFETIIDARERLLAPGGTLIPRQDTMWVALVEAPEPYAKRIGVWEEQSRGFDVAPLRKLAPNDAWKETIEREQLRSDAVKWATLDYAAIGDVNVSGEAALTVTRAGTAHALCVWFDSELADGIGFSNAPGAPELINRQWLFSLSEPVAIETGEVARMRIDAALIDDDYVWRWRTQIGDRAAFDQSTLAGLSLSWDRLRRSQATHVPEPTPDAEVVRLALSRMGTGASLAEIAAEVAAAFPDRVPTEREALHRVAALSQKYSR